MHFVVVEDDQTQAEEILESLAAEFPGSKIELLKCESEFVNKVDEIVKAEPSVLIMDVMVRWSVSRRAIEEPPDEIADAGPYRAGLRCENLYRSRGGKRPVVLFTLLASEDLEGELPPEKKTMFLNKGADYTQLFRAIREVTR
jgi:hypothetical protein